MKAVANGDGTSTLIAVEDGQIYTGLQQDCQAIADAAQEMHNTGYQGPSKDMKLAASVPFALVDKYLVDNGLTMSEFGRSPEHQRRFLNDPALAHFRVWKGRV